MRDLFDSHIASKKSKVLRVGKNGRESGNIKNTLKKMMVNFNVKNSMKSTNTSKCRVSILGQYQIFGHEDFLRKRPYTTSKFIF